ncbi:MAG: gamma-glutamylcyclotransferase family protein [Sulfuricurvum sp.]
MVQGRYRRIKAGLRGFERYSVLHEEYPGILPSPHARVEGIVYFDVDESDLAVLDDFEGEYYFRTSVSLESPDQGALQAEVYVIRSEYSNLLSGESWSETKFETVGLPRFMKQYLG